MNNLSFKNVLNELILANMTAKEIDLFFALLFKFSEMGTNEIKISFLEMKKLMNITSKTNNKQFIGMLDKMIIKSHKTIQKTENKKKREYITVFSKTSFCEDEQIIISKLNDEFLQYLKIQEKEGFTVIDIEKMTKLKSKYSKLMYKIVKQWEIQGRKEIEIEIFKESLGVPKNYEMTKIDERVLSPICSELKEYFPGLTVEKVKSGKGSKVTKLIFTWKRVERKKKSSKEIIQPQQLPSGAKKKFSKELALEQTARAEEEVQELKSKENNVIDLIENLKEKKEIQNNKPYITETEFENMYQDWLKIQNAQDNKYTKKGYRIQIEGQYKILENKKAL